MFTPKNTLLSIRASLWACIALLALALLLLVLHAPEAYASSDGGKFASAAQAHTLAMSEPYTLSLPLVMSGCRPPGPAYHACVLTIVTAALYSGPGSEYYTWLGNLPPKTSVAPLAQYGEYTKVAAVVNDSVQVGFVPTAALSPLQAGLPILGAADVPVKDVDFVKYLLLSPIASGTDDLVVLDNTSPSGWNGIMPLTVDHVSPFTLTFQIDTSNNSLGTIRLADLPLPIDDWWKGVRYLDIYTDNGLLGFALYDGVSPSPVANRVWDSDQQVVTISSANSNGRVFVVLDQKGKQIDKIDITAFKNPSLAQGLFPEGRAFFGRVVAPQTQMTVRSLSLRLQPGGALESLPNVAQEPTLRRLGNEQGILMGAGFAWWSMSADPNYRRTIENVYSTLVLSDFSAPSFWPARGEYEFDDVDSIVDWAVRSGNRLRASHLVWGALESKAVPDWLVNGNFTRNEYIQILEEHVKTVVGHYRGRVHEWSIANEAIGRSGFSGGDFWNEKIGPEYISMAFRWARETDPDAVLIFNEVNNEDPRDDRTEWVVENMLARVEALTGQGVPIDVVGMQMHLLLPAAGASQIPPTKEGVLETMQRFGALGVRIYITEMDVNLEAVEGTQEEKWQFEADLYRDMAEACIESGVCDSFSTWGVGDKDSWLTCMEGAGCQKLPNADPLMFDKDYQPKPAFFAVYDAFAQGLAAGDGR